ncbi:uncharacterized protein LOC129238126 [Anastrepha obliqua]|uniref:uncharacterized protein LOC129238126 n=1 Tax=Anastrepha obliqua TaxID=95512 RepID=UPI00240A13CB|nr:uncharacterized protein LOC129238126 [Anastrepha obliqua]
MNCISSVLSLLTFCNIFHFNFGEPIFGSENVHIKVHLPEEISAATHTHYEPNLHDDPTIICIPTHKILQHHRQRNHRKHLPHKSTAAKPQHTDYDTLLTNILLSDLKTPISNPHMDYLKHTDHITKHSAYPIVQEDYDSHSDESTPKSPTKYVQTYKLIETYEPPFEQDSSAYQNHHHHKHPNLHEQPQMQSETIKIYESKYQKPRAEFVLETPNSIGVAAKSNAHRMHTKIGRPYKDLKGIMEPSSTNGYVGHKSYYSAEKSLPSGYGFAKPTSFHQYSSNTDLTANENYGASKDTSAADMTEFFVSKESLDLPNKEAKDFHAAFQYPTLGIANIQSFIGNMYLPGIEESPLAQIASETYVGIDSYAARHVQGVDDLTYSPYRDKFI